MTSRLLETLRETGQDFADIGLIDAQTMREFDASSLPPVKDYTADEIRRLRLHCRASQAVFAAYLITS
jgi:putative transcriptional regulator